MSDKKDGNSMPWEIAGTLAGLVCCACVTMQIFKEHSSEARSSLSPGYTVGFLLIFMFWTFYGIRFGRAAVWVTNGIATLLQAVLLIVTMLKV